MDYDIGDAKCRVCHDNKQDKRTTAFTTTMNDEL